MLLAAIGTHEAWCFLQRSEAVGAGNEFARLRLCQVTLKSGSGRLAGGKGHQAKKHCQNDQKEDHPLRYGISHHHLPVSTHRKSDPVAPLPRIPGWIRTPLAAGGWLGIVRMA